MGRDRTHIWYDLTMALVYPSVLGAVIYAFIDASVQVSASRILDMLTRAPELNLQPAQSQGIYFFAALGLPPVIGFVAYMLITLFVIVHYSVDYLYSKYSESNYCLRNFLWDTGIALLLAVAFVVMSKNATKDLDRLRIAFVVFWAVQAAIYLVFLWWDLQAYMASRGRDPCSAQFYRSMVWPFEISAIAVFAFLAVLALQLQGVGLDGYAYLSASIVALGLFSIWFAAKVRDLEALSCAREKIRNPETLSAIGGEGMNSTIRGLRSTDVRVCARIFADAYRDVYGEPWLGKTAEARLSELHAAAGEYGFVLTIDEMIIGFIIGRPFSWFDGQRVWVEELVVDKPYRGQGAGRQLMKCFLDKCLQTKVAGVALISKQGSVAFGIYERLGMQPSEWIHLEVDTETLAQRMTRTIHDEERPT